MRQLSQAEQTKSIGWLLYSAPEYNIRDLQKQIKQETGIKVALHFQTIRDIRPAYAKRNKSPVKAIHLEVDHSISPQRQQHIEQLYSPVARKFPRGIKMRLVPPIGTLTASDDHIKAAKLISLQARFLAHTEIMQIHGNGLDVYNTFRKMTTSASQKNQPGKPLFHAISRMAKNEGYIVQYLPQYSIQARAAIAQLSD